VAIINQLAGRGIPIIGELTKQFGVSDFEVKKLVESSPRPSGRRSSRSPSGRKVLRHDGRRSQTSTGLFSTLKDAINAPFPTLGQPINDAIRLRVAEAITMVWKLAALAKRMPHGPHGIWALWGNPFFPAG
jgi:hypothetical protein